MALALEFVIFGGFFANELLHQEPWFAIVVLAMIVLVTIALSLHISEHLKATATIASEIGDVVPMRGTVAHDFD